MFRVDVLFIKKLENCKLKSTDQPPTLNTHMDKKFNEIKVCNTCYYNNPDF